MFGLSILQIFSFYPIYIHQKRLYHCAEIRGLIGVFFSKSFPENRFNSQNEFQPRAKLLSSSGVSCGSLGSTPERSLCLADKQVQGSRHTGFLAITAQSYFPFAW